MATVETPQVRLNPRVKDLRPSSTLAVNEKCASLKKQGRTIYQLGFGQSPFPVPPSVVEALRRNAAQKDYLPVKGLGQLREAVAAYHRRKDDAKATADDVLIGPGSKELIFLLQLTFNGDLVLPAPSWVSYEPQAVLLNRRVCWIDTRREEGWRLTADRLAALCSEDSTRQRLLILNYPNNPTGLTYREPELQAIARVAREYDVLVLSDEIYGELDYSGNHVSIARYYPEGTIISGGISKWCGAGGWRLGSFCFPKPLRWLLDAMAVVASESYSAVSAPIQHAAVTAFNGGPEIETYLRQSRRILKALGQHATQALRGADVQVHQNDGAYYLFPDFSLHREALSERGITTGAQFCERLLAETGVAILPGSDFGRPATELTARIAHVNFDGASCLAALAGEPDEGDLSSTFLRSNCNEVLEAFALIGNWLASPPR